MVTRPDVAGLARVTLTSFSVALVASLFIVVPRGGDSTSVGWDLVGLGSAAAVLIIRSVVAGIRSQYRTLSAPRLFLRFGSNTLCLLGVIAVGVILARGDYQDGLAWLAGLSIFLVLTSLRNSWDLLVSVGTAMHASTTT